MIKCNAIRFVIVVTILCGCTFARGQDAKNGSAEFDRLCDVSWMYTPYDVGADFSVTTSYLQTSLPGIRVVLEPSRYGKAPVTSVTDSSGTAHFVAVPPGKYVAGVKDGFRFPSNEVTVHASGDFDKEINMEWPIDSLPVRTLHGKLIAPGVGPEADRPFRSVTVKLVDFHSLRVVETQRTIEDGSYQFSTIEPGLYAVEIIPPHKGKKIKPESGGVAIELDPAALESTIPDLKVVQSACAGVQLFRKVGKEWREQ